MNLIYEIFEGNQESDWESESVLEIEVRSISVGTGESEMIKH